MNALISIIVPVYNMERYLPKCIESLLAQTYSNLEIILVDDGSKDNSLSVCEQYARKDSRIVVVRKENGGLSSARNAGLDVMRGAYVSFVDADDYLNPESIYSMRKTLVDTDAEIAYMQSNIVRSDYTVEKSTKKLASSLVVHTSADYIKGMCKKQLSESVCDKMFDVRLFQEKRFESGRLNEDFFFLSKLLFADIKIAEIDYIGYNYYQRPGSITHMGFCKSLVDAVKNSYELKILASEQRPDLELYFVEIALFQARTALLTMPWSYIRSKSVEYQEILSVVRNCRKLAKKTGLSKADKAFLSMVSKCPKLTLRFTTILWSLKNKRK